jgi:hypothetical protein
MAHQLGFRQVSNRRAHPSRAQLGRSAFFAVGCVRSQPGIKRSLFGSGSPQTTSLKILFGDFLGMSENDDAFTHLQHQPWIRIKSEGICVLIN